MSTTNTYGKTVELRERFRTLDLSATASYNSSTFERLNERAMEVHRRRHGPDSANLIVPANSDGGGWARHTWRVRWRPPFHWREELAWPSGQTTVIIIGPHRTLSYVSNVSDHGTMYTSAPTSVSTANEHTDTVELPRPPGFLRRGFGKRTQPKFDLRQLPTLAERVAAFPLLQPSLPESEWKFDALGDVMHAGRRARQVRATRRAGMVLPDGEEPSGYWPGINQYTCLVDDALGILLRLTGLVDDATAGDISANEVRVNAPLPSEIFSFVPPPDTRIVHLAPRA